MSEPTTTLEGEPTPYDGPALDFKDLACSNCGATHNIGVHAEQGYVWWNCPLCDTKQLEGTIPDPIPVMSKRDALAQFLGIPVDEVSDEILRDYSNFRSVTTSDSGSSTEHQKAG